MKKLFYLGFVLFFILKCNTISDKEKITIAFGSCNNQNLDNTVYNAILKNKPEIFIFGGDVIYSDTDKPSVLKNNFNKLKKDSTYIHFKKNISVIGTWDDHDYGINDGGFENPIKDQAQQLFLDFFDVSKSDLRRKQKGVFFSKIIQKENHSVKLILLDTRYFRSVLTKDITGKKRYSPTLDSTATMLGKTQWKWLEKELKNSKSDFNILVSSIQFLSDKHGFESWGNMPNEVQKMKNLILDSNAKNVIILSGDRHIAEISKENIGKFTYPLVDFTSSGLTHAYDSFSGEENPFRISKVIHQINFGIVKFDFKTNRVTFEIKSKDNLVLDVFTQQY